MSTKPYTADDNNSRGAFPAWRIRGVACITVLHETTQQYTD